MTTNAAMLASSHEDEKVKARDAEGLSVKAPTNKHAAPLMCFGHGHALFRCPTAFEDQRTTCSEQHDHNWLEMIGLGYLP